MSKLLKEREKDFSRSIKNIEKEYFKKRSKYANAEMIQKIVIILTSAVFFWVLITWYMAVVPVAVALLWWACQGFTHALIGTCIMHDASHGSLSSKKWINQMFAKTFDLVGGYSPIWHTSHVVRHHADTNIVGLDDDLASGKPFLRFSPYFAHSWVSKRQHYIVWFIYFLPTLFWVTVKDFIKFIQYKRDEVKGVQGSWKGLILQKVAYHAIFWIIPWYVSGAPWWLVLTGFLIMHFVAGITLSVIFQPTHVNTDAMDFATKNDAIKFGGRYVRQIVTTCNFAGEPDKNGHLSLRSRIVTWISGGLDHQIEHHIFPGVCHVHYPHLAPKTRKVCKEFGVPYTNYGTLRGALRAHNTYLKELALEES